MGAEQFFMKSTGKTAQEAFRNAVDQAAYEHGHSGYTGTIAEKSEYTMIPLPEGKNPTDYANELMDNSDPRVDDKWGPAGCFDLGKGSYLFFGWASS
jgi:hypothetical protein